MKINSGQAPSTLIPEYIGTDFDKVITVADNLNDIKTVSTNINDVVAVGDNILDVNTVAADVEDVTLVADNIDYVKDVAEGIEGLPVSGYIGDTPPTQPKVGATWYCTLDGRNYTWYEDVDSGQWVESSPQSTADDPHLAGNIFALWKRSAAEAGYNLVVGSFEEGGVLTSSTDVLLHKESKSIYAWTGAFPKVVAPGTDPTAVAGYVPRTDVLLRADLETGGIEAVTLVVSTFAEALLSSATSARKISTIGHTIHGVGQACYHRTGTTGTPSTGDEVLFYDALGNGWELNYNYSAGLNLLQLGLAHDTTGLVDQKPVFNKGFAHSNHLIIPATISCRLGSTLKYPRNGCSITGGYWAPFSSNTTISPVASGFTDGVLIDMHEAASGEGGQFNRLANVCINGCMANYTNAADPYAALVGVSLESTRDCPQLENVSFRACGKPFIATGYIHWLKNIYVYQCYEGPDVTSTSSSSIDTYVIQTCAKNWGSLTNCAVHNATIQQGNEHPTLDDDIGVRCYGQVDFTGYFYTEGGSAQINVEQDAVVTIDHALLGFTQKTDGQFGHHNINVTTGSVVRIRGGKKGGTSSLVVGGSPNSAAEISLDIAAYDGRIFDDAIGTPVIPNLLLVRSWGRHTRRNFHNVMEFAAIQNMTSAATTKIFNPGVGRFGGTLSAVARGYHVRDYIEVTFSNSTETTPMLATVTKRHASTSANIVNLSVSGDYVIATVVGTAPCSLYYSVEAWGTISMKNPATL